MDGIYQILDSIREKFGVDRAEAIELFNRSMFDYDVILSVLACVEELKEDEQ